MIKIVYVFVFTRMSCFYEAFSVYGTYPNSNHPNYSEFLKKCGEFCKLSYPNTTGQQELNLSVSFKNSSTTISSKQKRNLVINCAFPRDTDDIQSTSLTTQTETYLSTLLVDITPRTSETSEGSSDTDTTSEFSSVFTQTHTSVSTEDTPKTSQSQESSVNVVTKETGTTTSMKTSTSNPQNRTCTPQFESKTPCIYASSSGAFVGAVLGGGVLGAVITIIVFVLFHEKLSNLFKKYRMTLGGLKNPVYQPEVIHLDDMQTSPATGTGTQGTDNYNEIIEPTHIVKPSLQQHEDSSRKDDVYNHLHESQLHQSKKGDRSDNYDHAVLTTADGSGYGMVSIDRKINDNYCEVDPTSISSSATPRSEENNPYFTLEAQDD